MNIIKILESGDVSRFHSTVSIAKQNIAEHSWGVALLCQFFNPDCNKELILAALTHDCAEIVTGDTPSPAKWAEPQLKVILDTIERKVESEWGILYELSKKEKRLLKLCDALEGMNYCIKRRLMGEINVSIPFYRWVDFILDNTKLNYAESSYFNVLLEKMKEIK